MNEVLELSEIKLRFPNEWVYVDEPETDESLNVIRGRVIGHSPDPDTVSLAFRESGSKRWAVVYTGEPPEDMAFAL